MTHDVSSLPRRTALAALLAILAFFAFAFARAESALAVDCAPGPQLIAPLAGSGFQALDGDQCNSPAPAVDPTSTDWEGLVAAGAFLPGGGGGANVDDPATEGEFLGGGPQKENNPNNWNIGPGDPASDKSNIFANWGATKTTGDFFLYLAYHRQSPNNPASSSANFDFELNQNSASIPQSNDDVWFTNLHGIRLLKRRVGDRLIVFDQTGSTPADITICTWINPTNSPTPWIDGDWSCPGTPQSATGLAQGIVNDGFPITNFLPGEKGAAYDTDTTTAGTQNTMLSRTFGEAVVNLQAALGLDQNNPCATFGSLSMRSRQSPSVSADLADWLAPIPLIVSNCGKVVIKKETTPANTGDSFPFDGNGFNAPVVTSTPNLADENAPFTIQSGGQQVFENVQPNAGGAAITMTETSPGPGYVFDGLSCTSSLAAKNPDGSEGADPDSVPAAAGSATANIHVSKGETVTCTYKNTKQATISFEKNQIGGPHSDPANPDSGTEPFSFSTTGFGPAGPFNVTESDSIASQTYAVTPAAGGTNYTIAENQKAGWQLTDLDCFTSTAKTTPFPAAALSGAPGAFPAANEGGVTVNLKPGETVHCVFEDTQEAKVSFEKVQLGGPHSDPADPDSGTEDFSFTTSGLGAPGAFDVKESDPVSTTTYTVVPAAGGTSVSITEGQKAAWTLTGLDCFTSVGGNTPFPAGQTSGKPALPATNEGGVTLNVQPGDTAHCVFTDTRESTISFEKVQVGGPHANPANPDSGTEPFSFSTTGLGAPGPFDVKESDPLASTTYTVVPDAAGTNVSITENQKAGWQLTGLTCYTPALAPFPTTGAPALPAKDEGGVSMSIKPGDDVHCMFTDTKEATIVVEKQTDPDETNGATFGFTTDAPGAGTFSLQDDGQESRQVLPGTYKATEDTKTGYRLEGIACDAGGTGDKPTRTATFTPGAGDVIKCVFTNTKIAAKTIVVKAGNEFAYHGDSVTYTFKVTNTGNSPLTDVVVSDDRCAPVTGPDKGADATPATLDPNETWTYSCTTTISATHSSGEENPIHNTVTVTAKDEQGQPVGPATDDHLTLILHPAIAIDKTGPATATAGSLITYTLTVTNPGDVPFDEGRVEVTDPLCQAPPQVQQKFAGAGNDADGSPAVFNPGDRWVYTCSVQTQAGQTLVDNDAFVKGTDGNGRIVGAQDNAKTTLQQPVQIVEPLRNPVRGTAKLLAPSGCRQQSFTVRVTGRQIKTVTFTIDGKRVKTVRAAKSAQLVKSKTYKLVVDPSKMRSGSVHRLKVRITYVAAAQTKAKTLTSTFQRCRRAQLPRFTG